MGFLKDSFITAIQPEKVMDVTTFQEQVAEIQGLQVG